MTIGLSSLNIKKPNNDVQKQNNVDKEVESIKTSDDTSIFSKKNNSGAKTSTNSSGNEVVAIVDDFTNKTIDLDKDGKADISHGELVTKTYAANNPEAEVKKFNVGEKNGAIPYGNITNALDEIEKDSEIDVVNMSLESSYYITQDGNAIAPVGVNQKGEKVPDKNNEIVLKKTNEDDPAITVDNLDENNEALESYLPTEMQETIDTIEKSDKKIYIAAGNEGKNSFNIFNLADNAISVGTEDDYSADNDLVDVKEKGTYELKAKNGGFDIDGDGKNDIDKSEISSDSNTISFSGTSFASPTAAGKETKNKNTTNKNNNDGNIEKNTNKPVNTNQQLAQLAKLFQLFAMMYGQNNQNNQ